MFAYARSIVQRAEDLASRGEAAGAWKALRELCLHDFGELMWSLPTAEFPAVSALLPEMAADQVQRNWTGTCGVSLLQQTANFVRSMGYHYAALTGRGLEGARILDFGCGYGRIARLMYRYSDPERFYGCDPWDESIRLCRESRLPGNFAISDYVPRSLPFAETRFQLIYCFSVFTHLSLKTTRAVLSTLRGAIAEDGVLVITIRPEEYWHAAPLDPTCTRTPEQVVAEHRGAGFAFVPHKRDPIDGDITYGDTSMTMEWLAREFPQWAVRAHDRSIDDPLQIIVYLTPR